LMQLQIPSHVAKFGHGVFMDVTRVEHLTLVGSVFSQAVVTALEGCLTVDAEVVGAGIPSTASPSFTFYRSSHLTQLEIPSTVTTIGECAFWRCSGLTQAEIPSNVTVIGEYAFRNCSGLRHVKIPLSVTRIAEGTFWGCSALTGLEIPSSVTTIGDCAFYGCSRLTRVQVPAQFAKLGNFIFSGETKLEHLTLVGSVLSPAVVIALEGCLASTAKVVGAALAGRKFGPFTFGGVRFGRFTIVAA
jgi:hypothetical protein